MSEQLIYSKIANILKETKAITKSEKNQQQGFKFRGIDNVMNELHELFSKNRGVHTTGSAELHNGE
jgi:hypothetical protein